MKKRSSEKYKYGGMYLVRDVFHTIRVRMRLDNEAIKLTRK
jgi:hypothetical protein